MTLTRALWCLIAAFCLLPALAHAQAPVQVPSKRAITGAPPLFRSQPDREIPGRFVSFTPSGCALSFSANAVRGLSWSGACSGGRMQGQGTVMGYDDEQQPMFFFEGFIDHGLRKSGVMYEIDRKDGVLIGWRTAIVGSALQPHTEVRFLDMPRPFLLALDDWNRQTDGKNLLASMGATWAPGSAGVQQAKDAQGVSEGLGKLLGAIEQYQQAKQGRQQAPGQTEGGSSASGLSTSGGSGAGNCERKGFKIITAYSSGQGYEVATWTPQNCGRFLYENRGNRTLIALQNTCGCNIVMYVHVRSNDHLYDDHLKAHQTTSFGTYDPKSGPTVKATCDTEGMGGDFPHWHEETNTCRVRPCSLNGTCTNKSSTAN